MGRRGNGQPYGTIGIAFQLVNSLTKFAEPSWFGWTGIRIWNIDFGRIGMRTRTIGSAYHGDLERIEFDLVQRDPI